MILLSVLVPNYNHAQYLPRCLDSIFAGVNSDCEVIVCDDGSRDHSLEVLREYRQRYPALKILENPKNLGANATISRLYRAAAGEYVLSMGADDALGPGFLPLVLAAIAEHRPPMLFSDIRQEIVEMHISQSLTFGREARLVSGLELAASYQHLPYFIGGSSVHRRELLLQQVETTMKLGPLLDFWLNHWIAFQYGAYHIPGEFSHFMVRSDSFGATSCSVQVYRELLNALARPENRELRSYFRRSRVLRLHGLVALCAILSSWRDLDLLDPTHLLHAVRTELLRPIRRNLPRLYGKLATLLRGAKPMN